MEKYWYCSTDTSALSPNWHRRVTDTLSFNLPRILEIKWRSATADLLSGTISVFDIDTQVCGRSRKQQMLRPQGVNTGICRMDPPSVAFVCTCEAEGTGSEPGLTNCSGMRWQENLHNELISLLSANEALMLGFCSKCTQQFNFIYFRAQMIRFVWDFFQLVISFIAAASL